MYIDMVSIYIYKYSMIWEFQQTVSFWAFFVATAAWWRSHPPDGQVAVRHRWTTQTNHASKGAQPIKLGGIKKWQDFGEIFSLCSYFFWEMLDLEVWWGSLGFRQQSPESTGRRGTTWRCLNVRQQLMPCGFLRGNFAWDNQTTKQDQTSCVFFLKLSEPPKKTSNEICHLH